MIWRPILKNDENTWYPLLIVQLPETGVSFLLCYDYPHAGLVPANDTKSYNKRTYQNSSESV